MNVISIMLCAAAIQGPLGELMPRPQALEPSAGTTPVAAFKSAKTVRVGSGSPSSRSRLTFMRA